MLVFQKLYKNYIKRVIDFILATAALFVFSPLLIVIAALVRIKLGSPVIFRQQRPGKDGKVFWLYKFRTMKEMYDQNGTLLPDDMRLTEFGKMLRSTSLDELPELWNIIKGDMSIVGPRPLLVEYLPLYNARQRRRHEVRPGITGLAQVCGRNSISWEKRFEMDVNYVNRMSFLLDYRIIVQTVRTVLKREGISSATSVTMEPFRGNRARYRDDRKIKMKILYISMVFPKSDDDSTIYTDLAEKLSERGHQVTVIVAEERKNFCDSSFSQERGCRVLRVKVGNMYNVNFVEKGISIITLPYFIREAIKKNLQDEKFDLILFEAPPATLAKVIMFAKQKFHAPAFLMMKDIFPQNAIDIGIMKKGIIYCYFRLKEKKLYKTADMIGYMSEGNREYLVSHNKIADSKLTIFPNTKKIHQLPVRHDDFVMRKKYGIPEDKTVFVFGGNMGKPQGLPFLCNAIKNVENKYDAFFVLIGKGTEKVYVQDMLKGCKNALVLDSLPRDEYEQLILECDIGIVSLDYRFTIPNYPSRILSYLEYAIPVLAVTDKNTDFQDLIKEADCGLWCYSNSLRDFAKAVEELTGDVEMRYRMGQNGRSYMEKHFDVKVSVKLLEDYYEEQIWTRKHML